MIAPPLYVDGKRFSLFSMNSLEDILDIENVLETLRHKRVSEADTQDIAAMTDEEHRQADELRRLLIAKLSPPEDMRLEVLRESRRGGSPTL